MFKLQMLILTALAGVALTACTPGAVNSPSPPAATLPLVSPTNISTQPTLTGTPATPTTGPTIPLPSATTSPQSQLDCSMIERLDPNSDEAQQIVSGFIEDYRAAYPTEYMAFENLWALDRLGDFILIQGNITSEQRDALLVQEEGGEYTLLEHYIGVGQPLVSRHMLPEFFEERAPQAPPELFECMDMERFVEVPPAGEFTFDPQADCSQVESIPVQGETGIAIAAAVQGFYQSFSEELVDIETIQRQGEYYAVTAGFKVNPTPGLRGFFILKGSDDDYEVLHYIGGAGAPTRSIFIRNLYAEVPELPSELLNCLDVALLFTRLTPAP